MNPLALIDKYYPEENELKHILLTHSRSVADKALAMARNHPELNLDLAFVEEAAMLHDIGIFRTDADEIHCFGTYPYICHGYLGSELVAAEGFPKHALVCERHTGAGLSLQVFWNRIYRFRIVRWCRSVWKNRLFVLLISSFPKRNWTGRRVWKKARNSIAKYGEEGLIRFDHWCELFL